MKHTLVTFLGKGRENKETGYRRANYSFPSGKPIESPFFGLSLAGYLDPDAVVILGTEGSQWVCTGAGVSSCRCFRTVPDATLGTACMGQAGTSPSTPKTACIRLS